MQDLGSPAFTEAITTMHKTTAITLDRFAREEADYRKRIADAEGALIGCTKQFLSSGIAFASQQLQQGIQLIPGCDAKGYFTKLANELNRPFLYAEWARHQYYVYGQGSSSGWKYREHIKLTVPGTNRLKNVVAGLNLVAKPGGDLDKDGPLLSRHSERVWRFDFMEKGGYELFEAFVQQCATDPIMRITLNLGNLKR
jgi:hypothetical protein